MEYYAAIEKNEKYLCVIWKEVIWKTLKDILLFEKKQDTKNKNKKKKEKKN